MDSGVALQSGLKLSTSEHVGVVPLVVATRLRRLRQVLAVQPSRIQGRDGEAIARRIATECADRPLHHTLAFRVIYVLGHASGGFGIRFFAGIERPDAIKCVDRTGYGAQS